MALINLGCLHRPFPIEALYIGACIGRLPQRTLLKLREVLRWMHYQE